MLLYTYDASLHFYNESWLNGKCVVRFGIVGDCISELLSDINLLIFNEDLYQEHMEKVLDDQDEFVKEVKDIIRKLHEAIYDEDKHCLTSEMDINNL